MRRFWKLTAGLFGALLVAAFGALSYIAGSPKDVYGKVRYALPPIHPWTLKIGRRAADNAYSAWPERIYIIDESGHIAYRGGMGPFNYKPEKAREWLAARYGAVKHEAAKSTPDAVPAQAKAAETGAAPPTPLATSTPAQAAPAK